VTIDTTVERCPALLSMMLWPFETIANIPLAQRSSERLIANLKALKSQVDVVLNNLTLNNADRPGSGGILQSRKSDGISKDVYDSWVGLIEQHLVSRYRDSVRNHSNKNPVFRIDDIPKRTAEGGFGLSGIQGSITEESLLKYADQYENIKIDLKTREFVLTDKGKAHMLKLDPHIE
jgi:hypothetical protein